jgi:O-antigen/teichoic acid export membrane protein
MSVTRKIAGNASVQVVGRVIGTVFGILTVAVMTRHLGQGGYGAFTTAMSYLQFFGILVDFGLTLTMAKLIAEPGVDESRVASNVFTLRLVTAALFFSIAPVIALTLPYSADVRGGILVAAFSFFFMALTQALVGVFQKHLAAHLAAIAEIVGRGVLFTLTLVAARYDAGLIWFMSALVAGNLAQFVLTLVFARRFVLLRPAYDGKLWRRIVRETWPIGLSIAFNLIYLKGDVIIMSLFRSQEEVGLYGAAYKVLDVVTVIPMIFMGLMLPLLTASWSSGDRAGFSRRLRKSFDVLALMALPLAVGAMMTAKDVMTLVAGDDFADSGRYLSILMLASSCVFLASVFGHAVVAIGMQKPMIWMYAINAAISLALYLRLVPQHGAQAAAWITVFSEAFILFVAGIAVCARTRVVPDWRVLSAAVSGSAVMYGALYYGAQLPVLARIILAASVYAIALLASKTVRGMARDFLGRGPIPLAQTL